MRRSLIEKVKANEGCTPGPWHVISWHTEEKYVYVNTKILRINSIYWHQIKRVNLGKYYTNVFHSLQYPVRTLWNLFRTFKSLCLLQVSTKHCLEAYNWTDDSKVTKKRCQSQCLLDWSQTESLNTPIILVLYLSCFCLPSSTAILYGTIAQKNIYIYIYDICLYLYFTILRL